jgi:hypothetical protein
VFVSGGASTWANVNFVFGLFLPNKFVLKGREVFCFAQVPRQIERPFTMEGGTIDYIFYTCIQIIDAFPYYSVMEVIWLPGMI